MNCTALNPVGTNLHVAVCTKHYTNSKKHVYYACCTVFNL